MSSGKLFDEVTCLFGSINVRIWGDINIITVCPSRLTETPYTLSRPLICNPQLSPPSDTLKDAQSYRIYWEGTKNLLT